MSSAQAFVILGFLLSILGIYLYSITAAMRGQSPRWVLIAGGFDVRDAEERKPKS
jgi:hypothetical protein